MDFPKLWIIVDRKSKKWLGTTAQRNKTAADLTSTGAPRFFTRRSAATQAMIWWQQGTCYYAYSIDGYQLEVEPRRPEYALEVVLVDLVLEEDYIDVVYPV